MATITMSTNSASTSNNGGTGNKKLRGALTVLQNDIDMADAILQNGGTALAANDIIQAIAVPANTMVRLTMMVHLLVITHQQLHLQVSVVTCQYSLQQQIHLM